MQLREYLPYDVRDVMRELPVDGGIRNKFRKFTLSPQVANRARSVARFAEDLGFGVSIVDLAPGMNGRLVRDTWSETGYGIEVASSIGVKARRFAVLHEMGHYYRHTKHDDPLTDVEHFDLSGATFYVDQQSEREANEFAEALLFGDAQLAAAVGLCGPDLPVLSNYFGVTERQVGVALAKLRAP